MAINQARILESLETLCSDLNPDEFIFSFLTAFGFPKSTVTRLRNPDDNRNIGESGDIGLKKKLYFKPVMVGTDVAATADALKTSDLITSNDIRFIIATDFDTLIAYDLKTDERLETSLSELDKQYAFFLPLAGYEKAIVYSEHPADIKASEKMGQLFDLIRAGSATAQSGDVHSLNVFLTRLLFCFYAEDTGIFKQGQMTQAIQSTTHADGSDVHSFFSTLFSVLNLPNSAPERKTLPSHFQNFPYVNGGLFREDEPIPEFSVKARRLLIDCGTLNWSEINPDIFGSMFQAVIDVEQRGNLGQHYTSVSNIMKVIQPLFLDKLYAELDKSSKSKKKLNALLIRLQRIRIFDPACGSGNFLIIAYKELRKFEMAVLQALNTLEPQREMYYSGIRLSQFYGIEIDDFPHEVALLSLWLIEHQMNLTFKQTFGYAEASLPLKDAGHIICDNSLRLNWLQVCPNRDGEGNKCEVYICGNPPFLSSAGRSDIQNADMDDVFSSFKKYKVLDLVACWFWKGAQYIQHSNGELAFVATNSVCQGEQVAILWPRIFGLGLHIHFAYQSFSWKNSAKSNAGVHVSVIGLSDTPEHPLIYKKINKEWHAEKVACINPYLVEGKSTIIESRLAPLSKAPIMLKGSQPTDGGNLLLSQAEVDELLNAEPDASSWIRPLLGATEFLQGKKRFCLWLKQATKHDLDKLPLVNKRVQLVKEMRLNSKKLQTRSIASTPHIFGEIRQPDEGSYIIVPSHSSERRDYIPLGFFSSKVISTNANLIIPMADLFDFGVINSEIHNDWMRGVAGRLKSDYRYSASLVYNTFPWPDANERQRQEVATLAEEVILIREDYPDKSLAQLYDPNKMPEPLKAAHLALDKAVERLYRPKPFSDASERLEHLFSLYEALIAAEQTAQEAASARKRTQRKRNA